ncbi:MAG: ArsR family transcriptional regulator, partial [Halobacteriales archaeon]
LSRKPCYVTEISEHLGVSPKAVIDHLRRLESAGLVESRTDEQRRKYFHIAENLRLEVTVAPYGFGMKSNYPASPSLDLSCCSHLSIEVADDGGPTRAVANGGTETADTGELAGLAAALEELEEIQRELSVAQRWVQGRIAGVLDRLSTELGGEGYLDAEVLAAVAKGRGDPAAISRELDLPEAVVEESLARLADRGVVNREREGWALAAA